MDSELQRAKRIFERAIELAPEARADYLHSACGDDAPLRERVERLLAAHAEEGDFLASRGRDQTVGRRRSLPRIVGHYRLLKKLGAGGMGEVWKAEDTQLRRTVALKFLAAATVDNEEIRARLIREAQAAAALDHPNICHVHGIHEEDGETFIAMVYVDGPSLAEKIKERPLPLHEALDIAVQIAEGLQEAHEKGIVHRDLKPANVMLTSKGRVKITDFGLASLAGRTKITKSGTTLGTPAYMAPEQLDAEETDRRADIWALGCVLYEMLTQRTPFEAESERAIAHGILTKASEPVTALRSGLPIEIDQLLGKALAKHPNERYQHAEELEVDLRAARKNSAADSGPARRESVAEGSQTAWQVALAAALIALAGVSWLHVTEPPIERAVRKWSFAPEALSADVRSVVVSPNGRHIAYVAGPGAPRLWVRDLARIAPRELAGTEGATQPFWSPDSRFIGFAAGGNVQKIPVREGSPTTLSPLPGANFSGGSWSSDGESVAFGGEILPQIFEVSARGGRPKLLFEPERSGSGIFSLRPHFLPPKVGKQSVLIMVGPPVYRNIVLKNLETGESLVLAKGEYPVFSPSGHVVYSSRGDLWALPFSLDALTPTGRAFPIVENSDFPSVSNDGTLVSVELRGRRLKQLVWRDRTGKKLGEIGQPQEDILNPVLSPKGGRVAVQALEGGNLDIWVHQVEQPMKRRLTADAAGDVRPQWAPSGREITFQSIRRGTIDIFRRTADGTGEAELLIGTEGAERPYGWSRDGNYFLYTLYTVEAEGDVDLWYLKRKGDGEGFESVPFLATPFNENSPTLSPDGRFVAYCSDRSGEDQVYVRPFPRGKGQWQVSPNGGRQPRWSRDGKELFYVDGDTLTAVEVTTSPNFAAVSTTRLFSDPHLSVLNAYRVSYDVSADGRFVLMDSVENAAAGAPSIQVIENWYEEFRDREQD